MPRRPRRVVPGYPHHLTLRGNNRRRLFSRPTDFLRFLAWLAEALDETSCVLYALTLMSNHIHGIFEPPDEAALSAFVKSFAQRYALWRNRMRGGSGKLFEERFHCTIIEGDEQLAAATAYDDLNPTRAGMVADALDYPWSTYPIHAGAPERSRIPVEIWTPSGWYLSLGDTAAERAVAYRDFAMRYEASRREEGRSRESAKKSERRPDGRRAL